MWELVLYLFALLQFIQSFARAWCLGNARMRMHGTADLGVAEMAAGWERLRDMCQWVFYIDLVLKLVRYRGLFPYLQADINHRLDVLATFFVVLASWTWEVPDMTALRGLRFFSLIALSPEEKENEAKARPERDLCDQLGERLVLPRRDLCAPARAALSLLIQLQDLHKEERLIMQR